MFICLNGVDVVKEYSEPKDLDNISFTMRGRDRTLETIAALGNQTTDDSMILDAMRGELKTIPFGDYLKRYIYMNSGMTGDFREIPDRSYRHTLMDAFRDHGTPSSMDDSEAHLSTVTKRWLGQYSVGRETALLIGFGLGMLEEEVNQMLMKELHDHRLDPENPLEGICQYCYRHRYGWQKMQQLRMIYEAGPERLDELLPGANRRGRLEDQRTAVQERELMKKLFQAGPVTSMARKTRETFQALFEETKGKIQLESSGRLGRDITLADIERVFCPIVMRDRHGNLKLRLQEDVKRELSSHWFTRQHLHMVVSGKKEPDRYDLLTMGFYLRTGTGQRSEKEERVRCFQEEMNRMLAECGYGPMYAADPYECFLMMAMASADPMDTFLSVMEKAQEQFG